MTTSQIIATVISCMAALVAIAAAIGTRRQSVRNRRERDRTFPVYGGEVTVTAPMSEAEYEAIKARWQAVYGSRHTAHHVDQVEPEEPPQ